MNHQQSQSEKRKRHDNHEIYDLVHDGQEYDEDKLEEEDYYDDELENEDGGFATSESLASCFYCVQE